MVDFLKDLEKVGGTSESKSDGTKKVSNQVDKITQGKVPTQYKGPWYYFSDFPNFSFIVKGTSKQIKFQGKYFMTEDSKIASYIKKCYSEQVSEITKEMYEDGTTLVSAPEKKSEIFNVKLPG